jgi:hypothetical protein
MALIGRSAIVVCSKHSPSLVLSQANPALSIIDIGKVEKQHRESSMRFCNFSMSGSMHGTRALLRMQTSSTPSLLHSIGWHPPLLTIFNPSSAPKGLDSGHSALCGIGASPILAHMLESCPAILGRFRLPLQPEFP